MAQRGEISVIVADITDRFGRGDAVAQLEILARLAGARVEYAQPGRDKNTVEGLAMTLMEQLVSGMERQNIRRRSVSGKRARIKEGRILATPMRPYGLYYHRVKDPETGRTVSCTLKPYEEDGGHEYTLLKWMFNQVLTQHWTCGQIARHLNENHIPPPSHNLRRSASQWWRESIHCMLTNRVYMGEYGYGKFKTTRLDTLEGIKYKKSRHEPENIIIVKVAPVVTPEQFELVQRQLRLNKNQKFRKHVGTRWLLRGRIKCAACGLTWCGRSSPSRNKTRRYRYYMCNGHWSRSKSMENYCGGKYVNAELIEGVVWDLICHEMQDVDSLVRKIKERHAQTGAARQQIEQMVAELEKKVTETNLRIDRIIELYSRGRLTDEQFERQKQSADQELEGILRGQKEWIAKLEDWPEVQPGFLDELNALRNNVAKRLNPSTPYEVREHIVDGLEIEVRFDYRTNEVVVGGLICPPKITLPDKNEYRAKLLQDGFEPVGDDAGIHQLSSSS